MNILIFVSVLLMVLASISYGEMEVFYRQSLSQLAWMRFVENIEGCLFNEKIQANYKVEPKSKKARPKVDSLGNIEEEVEKDDEGKNKKNVSTGSAKINFQILLGRAKNLTPEEEKQFDGLIKNLIVAMYEDTNFYQTLIEKRPNFLDELLAALKEFSTKKDPTKAKDLSKIKLSDTELKDAFYFLLREVPVENNEKKPCAHRSLYDYLNESKRTKIRVFLAPRELLAAAFDKQIADQIITKREELYKQVDKGYEVGQATEDFKNAFEAYTSFHDILDFTVTKTNPKTYK